jgi:2-phospho-L-lactate guanylyltransferase
MRLDAAVADHDDWTVVLPVKTFSAAKSRLDLPDSGVLARAFLSDVLAAAGGCARVGQIVLVTSDPEVGAFAANSGVRVVTEKAPGINPAAAEGARARHGSGPVAVLVSDLPCLTAHDLAGILDAAAEHAVSFLADAEGSGTTTWCTTGPDVATAFGVGSRSAHVDAGAIDLAATAPWGSWRRGRRDVDTPADLAAAVALGCGPATTDALNDVAVVTVLSQEGDALRVVDESGGVDQALAPAGLRDLRAGQRLLRCRGRLLPLH